MIKVFGGRNTGREHLSKGRGCDDAYGWRCTSSAAVVAVADGGGSRTHSAMGSHLAIQSVLDSVVGQGRASGFTIARAFAHAVQCINAHATGPDSLGTPRDYGTTLAVVVVDEHALHIGQIGDCLVFILDQDGITKTISPEESSEYANETTFITQTDAVHQIRFDSFKRSEVRGFALSTDGLRYEILDRVRAATPHQPFFVDLFREATETDALSPWLADFVQSQEPRSGDDATLVVAVFGDEGAPSEELSPSPSSVVEQAASSVAAAGAARLPDEAQDNGAAIDPLVPASGTQQEPAPKSTTRAADRPSTSPRHVGDRPSSLTASRAPIVDEAATPPAPPLASGSRRSTRESGARPDVEVIDSNQGLESERTVLLRAALVVAIVAATVAGVFLIWSLQPDSSGNATATSTVTSDSLAVNQESPPSSDSERLGQVAEPAMTANSVADVNSAAAVQATEAAAAVTVAPEAEAANEDVEAKAEVEATAAPETGPTAFPTRTALPTPPATAAPFTPVIAQVADIGVFADVAELVAVIGANGLRADNQSSTTQQYQSSCVRQTPLEPTWIEAIASVDDLIVEVHRLVDTGQTVLFAASDCRTLAQAATSLRFTDCKDEPTCSSAG